MRVYSIHSSYDITHTCVSIGCCTRVPNKTTTTESAESARQETVKAALANNARQKHKDLSRVFSHQD